MSLTYRGEDSAPENASTYNFTAISIGAADANRKVIATFAARKAGVDVPTITSATIGGVSATIDIQVDRTDSNSNIVAVLSAEVPTGTTAAVSVTLDQSMLRAHTAVYTLDDAGTLSAFDTDSDITASNPDFSYDTPTGASYAIAVAGSTAGTTASWSELTEDSDTVVESAFTASTASKTYATQTTGTTETATFAGGSEHLGAAVVYQVAAAVDYTITGSVDFDVLFEIDYNDNISSDNEMTNRTTTIVGCGVF